MRRTRVRTAIKWERNRPRRELCKLGQQTMKFARLHNWERRAEFGPDSPAMPPRGTRPVPPSAAPVDRPGSRFAAIRSAAGLSCSTYSEVTSVSAYPARTASSSGNAGPDFPNRRNAAAGSTSHCAEVTTPSALSNTFRVASRPACESAYGAVPAAPCQTFDRRDIAEPLRLCHGLLRPHRLNGRLFSMESHVHALCSIGADGPLVRQLWPSDTGDA